VTNNVALQLLRDAGNLNVGPDELLLSVPAIPVVANGLQQWIAAFINLSPNLQAQGAAVLKGIAGMTKTTTTTTRPSVSSVSKVLFDSSKETTSSSRLDSTYNFGIHHFIQDLANAGEYCPLMLFSNKNTEHLHREGHFLKCTKVHVNGVSHHLLDLSQFENKRDLDPLTWQEAFQCYLMWIGDVGDMQSLRRWTSHFTMLTKDEAIHKNFCAILKFDIETRQNYALHPHQHDEAEWSHRLQKKKYTTLQDELFRHSQQLCSSFADRSSNAGPSARFEPYDNAAKCPAKKHDGDLSSFETQSQASLLIPCASSVAAPVIASQRAPKRLHQKEHKILLSMQTAIFADVPTVLNSASDSISTTHDINASEIIQTSTSVPSAGAPSMVHSPAHAFDPAEEDHILVHVLDLEPSCSSSSRHIYFDNLQKHSSPHDLDDDYSLIKTPYLPDGFDCLLEATNLTQQFPELTWKLRHSFPIGDMKPLTQTYTLQNLPGADIYREVCDEYIIDELLKGRFSGPYTHQQLYAKIGHFHSSPLQVVVKKGINGALDKH
jgi:hypothetical protein